MAMQIYLDEAGNFIPGVGSRVSCGAALAVAESRAEGLFRAFATLTEAWDRANGGREVKGSALSEEQAAAVIAVAEQHDPLLVITAIDAGTHSDANVRAILAAQGAKITANLTDQHHPNLVRELQDLRANWERLSPQLGVQAFTFFSLVENVLRDATLYFVQRDPATLGSLSWVIDAKDPAMITNYEQVWNMLLKPYLQTRFLVKPLDALEGADYSAWNTLAFTDPIPAVVEARLPQDPTERGSLFDLRRLMADLRFEQSANPGLRLVDMLASAFRRAVAGHLRDDGWRNLGRLLVCKRPMVQVLELSEQPAPPGPVTNAHLLRVMGVLEKHCKPMLR
jgi:hypothetical protein